MWCPGGTLVGWGAVGSNHAHWNWLVAMKTESLKLAGTLDMPRQEGLRLQAILGYTKTPSQKGKKKPSTKSLCRAQAEERDIPYAPSQQDWLFFMK